jgi:transposase InsO family protein
MQEAIVVELRCTTLLPLDDLVAVVREFIHPGVSRSGLDRCLRRHGVANLRQLQAKALNIEHRLCPPRHPQTNGMVERFNGHISEVVNQTRFASAAQLEATLDNYVKTYNHLIPQRALNHLSPVQALKNWYAKKPQLFVKRVYNQPGLDT